MEETKMEEKENVAWRQAIDKLCEEHQSWKNKHHANTNQ